MANSTDTNGWHTVAAITYADVNAAIAASGSKPAAFQVSADDGSASASGTFGAWSLALGGSGPDINMRIEIGGGSITGPFGHGGAQATLPVAATAYPALVRANYVPHTDKQSLLNLVLDNAAPVTVGSPLGPAPTSSFLANAAMQELLQQWLTTNIAEFNVVFASVDLDTQYEQEGLNWLRPSYRGYAVSEPASGATLDNSVFGVLTLVDGVTTPPADLAYAVSAFAIPDGARASFLISTEKFLEHMLFAALPVMFKDLAPGSSAQHFSIANSGTQITNTNSVQLEDVKLDNGSVVNPSLDTANFSIEVDTTELVFALNDMQFEYSAGISVHLNYQGRATLSYDKTNGILDLAVVTQSGSGSVQVSQGLQIAEYIMGGISIVAAVVSGVGGIVAKSASAAVEGASATISVAEQVGEDEAVAAQATVSALRGLISGTPAEVSQIAARAMAIARVGLIAGFVSGLMPGIATILKAVADTDYQSMPKITDLTSAAIGKTVIWPSAVGNFKLDSAQLNGALQFGLVKA